MKIKNKRVYFEAAQWRTKNEMSMTNKFYEDEVTVGVENFLVSSEPAQEEIINFILSWLVVILWSAKGCPR